jgi:orotate phosphoribosyltransferase-like protein
LGFFIWVITGLKNCSTYFFSIQKEFWGEKTEEKEKTDISHNLKVLGGAAKWMHLVSANMSQLEMQVVGNGVYF